jgi:sugar phosphate permease
MRKNRWFIIFIIGFSGGIIYLLPYYSKYLLYDFMRDYFNLSHTEFGKLQMVYGIAGFLLYYPGGLLADRVSVRYLLSGSMIFSGILGFSLLLISSFKILVIVFILFSVATNLAFWVPSLKLVMSLGNMYEQGRVLGLFEGSKGVAGIIFGILAFILAGKTGSFETVILIYSFIITFCGVVVLFIIKDEKKPPVKTRSETNIITLVKSPKILIIGLVMFFYYIIYTNLVYLNPYLGNIYDITPEMVILFAFLRIYLLKIFISPLSGYIVDKGGSAIRVFMVSFFLLLILQSMLLCTPGNKEFLPVILINIILITILSIVFVSIKFSSLAELGIPKSELGKTIGFVSVIAYFPDIIYSGFIGEILDRYKNMSYKYIFFIGVLSAVGGILSCMYLLRYKNKKV